MLPTLRLELVVNLVGQRVRLSYIYCYDSRHEDMTQND